MAALTDMVIKIMHLAYLVHELTDYCVFVRFSGHIDRLEIDIRQSQEQWQVRALETTFYTSYKAERDNGIELKLANLKSKIAVLEQVLAEGEIPYEELDDHERYAKHCTF